MGFSLLGSLSWLGQLFLVALFCFSLVCFSKNFCISLFDLFQEALSLTEFELMELLDVGLSDVASAVAHISEIASPPYQTVSN